MICMSDVCPCTATEYQSESRVGNQAKPLKYSEKVVFCTNLEQTFKPRATDLGTQPTMQLRLTCALKNAKLLLPQR